MTAMLPLVVAARRMLTPDVCEFDLRSPDGSALPRVTAGAHLDVVTPAGFTNSYSLTGRLSEAGDRYRIAVDRRAAGAGGSRSMVDEVRVGDGIVASPPLNSFALDEADSYILIAAGIGITPILAMAHELVDRGVRDIELLYLTRSSQHAAYLDEITELAPAVRLTVHHRDANPGRYDLWNAVAEPGERQLYCCGPDPVQDEVRALTMHWRPSRVHFESFDGHLDLEHPGLPFEVVWEGDGTVVHVGEAESMLTALRRAGASVDSSCESGTCGTCILRVVSGRPDHRDVVLSASQQDDFVMPCVSRALDERLIVAPAD